MKISLNIMLKGYGFYTSRHISMFTNFLSGSFNIGYWSFEISSLASATGVSYMHNKRYLLFHKEIVQVLNH